MAAKRTSKKAAKKAARKAAKKTVATKRAPGKAQISISLDESLIEKIDRLAAGQNRNRSNFIATALAEVCDELE